MLPTDYQTFIALSRYARWLPKEKRRETWTETVGRWQEFWSGRYPKHSKTLKELGEAIVATEVMPSMRSLMTAGEALNRDEVAGFNCFGGDQEFITSDGIVSFAESCGTSVDVLAGDGAYRKAEVKSFGNQVLQGVTFRPTQAPSKIREYVEVTANHRWITENRGEVTDLRVGDSVRFNSNNSSPGEYIEAIIAGIGFGDGTLDSRGRARIRLCGDKAKYLHYFEEYGSCSIGYPPSYNGDPLVVFHKGIFASWKEIPYDKTNNLFWMKSWLKGYLMADGHDSPQQPGLSTQNECAADFVERIAPLCGYMVTGRNVSSIMETNYGKRKSPLIRLTLRTEGVWYVTAIEELEEQEVFCVVEPETHSFTLSSGMLTGNCSYVAVDSPRVFDETMYVLMCGTGLGFSVERQYISKLPEIAEEFHPTDTTIIVADSKVGWAKAFKELISLLYQGQTPKWDVSKVRKAGAPLKTFGGRASGPAPLEDLFRFSVETFTTAKGRKLTSIEVHDLMCKIADIVVVGGVRRSALISLSNLSDPRMRDAKSGQWWISDGQRALANNSVCYTEKPDVGIFMEEWKALYDSKSGERGIFNREAANNLLPERRRELGYTDWGCNPCCFTGDMKLLTESGYRRFDELDGSLVGVANNNGEVSNGAVWCSGEKPTVEVHFAGDKDSITCTPDHIFMLNDGTECEAKDLEGKRVMPYCKDSEAPYVSSVNDFGVHKVYDFTEPETHWGVVEGVVVHNSEIVLRSKQFCNLSEVVIRPEDTLDDLKRKVRQATIIGTFQSTLTNFRYLSSAWKRNTEEEALLGVSLTGIMDHPVMSGKESEAALREWLQQMKEVAVETNKEWAKKLGINPATAITAVKPSGTVSQLVNSASGIHPRYSPYYIRTVRSDKKDPLAQMMVEQGFPVEDDFTKPDSGYVFSFPMKAPQGSVMRDDMSAIEQCEVWKTYQLNWCEHKPSITVYVKEHEWLEVGAWVYANFDIVSGISFLPHSDHSYKQAPYQEITEEEYEEFLKRMPKPDWSRLGDFEEEDNTEGQQTLACTAGACEI